MTVSKTYQVRAKPKLQDKIEAMMQQDDEPSFSEWARAIFEQEYTRRNRTLVSPATVVNTGTLPLPDDGDPVTIVTVE